MLAPSDVVSPRQYGCGSGPARTSRNHALIRGPFTPAVALLMWLSHRERQTATIRRSPVCRVAFIIVVVHTLAAVYSAAIGAASFDCGEATSPTEKIVCEDFALSEMDESLAASYRSAYSAIESRGRKQLQIDQRRWLHDRDTCDDASCIGSAYEMRLSELNGTSECPLAHCDRIAEEEADEHLREAIESSDIVGLKKALSRGAAPDACGPDFRRPLHHAVFSGSALVLKELLRSKAKPDVMDCSGDTPITIAVYLNNMEGVKKLLSAGADVELGAGANPLSMAAFHGRAEMLEFLLARGANPNSIAGGRTSLLSAARNLHVESVRLLLEAGANPNFGSGAPLFEAVGGFRVVPPNLDEQERALKVVRLLLHHGAKVNARIAGQSALDRALALNESDIVKFLIQAGAEP